MTLPFPIESATRSARALRLRCLIATIALAASGLATATEYSDIQQLARDGKTAQALARIERGIAKDPKDPQLRFLKGVIQTDSGKQVDAQQTFLALTRQYPELPEPYNNLAAIYAHLNQWDKAREALEMAVRLNPGYAVAYENLGDIYARLAAEAYAKSSQLDAANPKLAPKLAQVRELLLLK